MSLALEIPRRIPDAMPLADVFEHRFAQLFARLKLEAIGDLRACREISASDAESINAHLRRCWWW
jgi:hypothetical protein